MRRVDLCLLLLALLPLSACGQALPPSEPTRSIDPSIDYVEALNNAAKSLRGEPPDAAQLARLTAAVSAGLSDGSEGDPSFVYEDLIRGYLEDRARFGRQIVLFFQTFLRMSGIKTGLYADSLTEMRTVSLDTGPAFAARLVVDDRDLRQLFTQSRNTCPTFVPTTAQFTDGACLNNVPEGEHAGILTNPGFLARFQPTYADNGFVRMVNLQELFACSAYPGEIAPVSTVQNAMLLHSPWPLSSVTSAANPPTFTDPRLMRGGGTSSSMGYTDFQPLCVNCHGTMNHRAPLFANFDQVGHKQSTFMVNQARAAPDFPFVQIQEYYPSGESTAWKYGVPAATLQQFGQAMSEDDEVLSCLISRFYNFAFLRGDVVTDQALVSNSVVAPLLSSLRGDGYNVKRLLKRIYTSPDFIRP